MREEMKDRGTAGFKRKRMIRAVGSAGLRTKRWEGRGRGEAHRNKKKTGESGDQYSVSTNLKKTRRRDYGGKRN